MQPFMIDPAVLGRRIGCPPIARDLADVGINSTIQMLEFFMLGDRAVADFSRPGSLNTDDHPRLEVLALKPCAREESLRENFAVHPV